MTHKLWGGRFAEEPSALLRVLKRAARKGRMKGA